MDIEALCNELLHELKAAFGDAQPLNFQLDDKLRIREENTLKPLVDGRIIRHVLSNLLSNALKYSDANGEAIALDIRCTDQQIEFIVQDRGIGIPQEDLEHLFEPFHRATNVGKIPGTGLGLHIVERYVKVHNGTIKVKSTLNLGTTFTVIIPCIFIRDL